MFVYTTAIKKIRALKKRVKVVQGGTSAGKTFGILPILIDKACKTNNLEISVVSESIPHLRRGAIKDFLKILKLTGRYVDEHWNRSLLTYTFANGSYIEFFSVEDESKVRGARRNVLYVNESNNVNWEAFHQLMIRTNSDVYIDFNPTNEFWAHVELVGNDDTDFIILNYKDNEALDTTIINEIEKAREKAKTSSYWANWWKVYGLGEIGSLEGVVFSNWSTIDMIPTEARLVSRGIDFGYTNDPTAIIEVWKYNDEYIIDEVEYRTQLTNQAIYNVLKSNNYDNNVLTICDSAEPKSISELRLLGVNAKATTKGKDSINHGVQAIQEMKLKVTSRSTNLIKELRGYVWQKDKTGASLNKPIDCNNHGIDAMRYALIDLVKQNYSTIDIR